MNEHLVPVFREVLPALEAAGVPYWVYGGMAVAGIVGRFIRENDDVDLYVLDSGFERARTVLDELCLSRPNWRLQDSTPLLGRPKSGIYVADRELVSIVPVYPALGVEFRTKFAETLPRSEALAIERRRIDAGEFVTPSAAAIRQLLRSLIKERPETLLRHKRRLDATAILTAEELRELGIAK